MYYPSRMCIPWKQDPYLPRSLLYFPWCLGHIEDSHFIKVWCMNEWVSGWVDGHHPPLFGSHMSPPLASLIPHAVHVLVCHWPYVHAGARPGRLPPPCFTVDTYSSLQCQLKYYFLKKAVSELLFQEAKFSSYRHTLFIDCALFASLHFTDVAFFFFFTNWRHDLPSAKRLQLPLWR